MQDTQYLKDDALPISQGLITLQRRLHVDMIRLGIYSASGPPVTSKEAEDVTSVSDRGGRVRDPPVYAESQRCRRLYGRTARLSYRFSWVLYAARVPGPFLPLHGGSVQ